MTALREGLEVYESKAIDGRGPTRWQGPTRQQGPTRRQGPHQEADSQVVAQLKSPEPGLSPPAGDQADIGTSASRMSTHTANSLAEPRCQWAQQPAASLCACSSTINKVFHNHKMKASCVTKQCIRITC